MLRLIVATLVAALATGCGADQGGQHRSAEPGGSGGIGGGASGEAPTGGGGGARPGGAGGTPAEGAMFVADDEGYVVMEMESVSIPDGYEWVEQTELADYTGTGYYRFVGNSICNGPAGNPLRYQIEIREGARSELRLRAAKIAHVHQSR